MLMQALEATGHDLIKRIPWDDQRLWHGSDGSEAMVTRDQQVYEPRILSVDVLKPYIVGSFAEEMATSALLQERFEMILSRPSAASWTGQIGEPTLGSMPCCYQRSTSADVLR